MGSSKPFIFISYSRKDRKWLDFVQGHLQVGVTNDHFKTWDDRSIAVGADWKQEIDAALGKCTAFILLVSRHSLTSDFILKEEVRAALEAHWERGVRIYPIIVRDVDIHAVPWLARMNVRPRDAKALALFPLPQREKVMKEIAAEIRGLVKEQPAPATPPPTIPSNATAPIPGPAESPGHTVVQAAGSSANAGAPYLRLTRFQARNRAAAKPQVDELPHGPIMVWKRFEFPLQRVPSLRVPSLPVETPFAAV